MRREGNVCVCVVLFSGWMFFVSGMVQFEFVLIFALVVSCVAIVG